MGFHLLDVKIPDEDAARLRRRADLLGMPFDRYIRWVLRKACPPDLEKPVGLEMREDWVPTNRVAALEEESDEGEAEP